MVVGKVSWHFRHCTEPEIGGDRNIAHRSISHTLGRIPNAPVLGAAQRHFIFAKRGEVAVNGSNIGGGGAAEAVAVAALNKTGAADELYVA